VGTTTASGEVLTDTGQRASFGLVAKVKNGAKGHFDYVNHATELNINGKVTRIYFVNASTRTIKLKGTTRQGCEFDVTVTDNGEPGANRDRFSLSATCASTVATDRPLRKGNIQWRPPGHDGED
jgi:hypothetical protein